MSEGGIYVRNQRAHSFVINVTELKKAPMWDVRYFLPKYQELIESLKNSKFILISLRNICKEPIKRGKTPVYSPKGIQVIKVASLKNEYIENTNEFVSEKFFADSIPAHVKQKDILIASTGEGSIGKVDIYESKDYAIADNHISMIRIDETKTNLYFILFYLRSHFGRIQIERVCKGATGQIELYPPEIGDIKIPLPPRPIQDKIVQIMEDAYKQKKEKLKEAEELLSSINDYFLDELGIEFPKIEEKKSFVISAEMLRDGRFDPLYYRPQYEKLNRIIEEGKYKVEKLGSLGKIDSGKRPKGGVRTIEEGIPSIGGEHIKDDGSIEKEKLKFIPLDFYKKCNVRIRPLDILIIKDGATTGKVGIVPLDYPHKEGSINEHIFRIRVPDKEIDSYYVFSFLHSKAGQYQLKREVTGGTIMGIVREAIKNIKIPYPPIEVQNRIAEEAKRRREKAKLLKEEAEKVVSEAKQKIEKMILGEE